jgi:hypothetical protein
LTAAHVLSKSFICQNRKVKDMKKFKSLSWWNMVLEFVLAGVVSGGGGGGGGGRGGGEVILFLLAIPIFILMSLSSSLSLS